MRSPAANAELALLLEVAGTPKPGNVDRERDLEDLHFEHFLAGAVGARPGLDSLALADDAVAIDAIEGGPAPTDGADEATDGADDGSGMDAAAGPVGIGRAFEEAVRGMSEQSGGNTQFGALLVLAPLVRAAGTGDCTPERAAAVVSETTVEDTVAFYRAFEHVDVFVGDPPQDAPDLDVRRGSDAIDDVRDRAITLGDLMARSAHRDGVAREWTNDFERVFDAGTAIAEDSFVDDPSETAIRPVTDRAADAFLDLLAREPDTLVAEQHGSTIAEDVTDRAADLRADGVTVATDRAAIASFAEELVERGVNPGTTADLTAAALFVALEHHGVSP